MKACDHLPHYLDGRLERAGREYFESHLGICTDCRKVVDAWACTKNVLRNEAAERQRYLVPTDDEAFRLVQRAQLDVSSRGFFSVRVLVPLTAAVSFVLAFFLASYVDVRLPIGNFEQSPPASAAILETADPVARLEELPVSNPPTLEYETKQYGRTIGRLGNDRFGLASGSKLRVVSTEGMTTVLRLGKGIAAFNVAKRKGGRKFVVEAGDVRVEVVGTRFTVDHSDDGVRVSVTEGIVAVSDKAGRNWRLKAGEALAVSADGTADRSFAEGDEVEETARLLGEIEVDESATLTDLTPMRSVNPVAMRSKKNKKWGTLARRSAAQSSSIASDGVNKSNKEAGPLDNISAAASDSSAQQLISDPALSDAEPKGLDLWRQWVLEGRFDAAETALEDHLSEHPMDTDAYSLLADCRRKAGKYAEAVETYKKLTAIAGDYQANRARFKAGVLLQENLKNHLAAAAIFDEYLATGKGTPLLRAKAAIRLAGSLIELGENERAKQLLRRIVADYSGSSVAIQAREMLNKVD